MRTRLQLSVVNVVKKFHRDETGMETVQIIMIMAIAAMILTGVNGVVGVNSTGSGTGGGLLKLVTGGLSKLFSAEGGGFFGGIGDAIGGLFG